MGSLIDGSDLVIWCTKLAPDTYKRRITNLQSGNRGRDSKIMRGLPNNKSKHLKIIWAKLNTHIEVSSNLCARVRVTT
jgi:hypothetical protein